VTVIHKYQFNLSDEVEIVVQGYLHKVLSIQQQNGQWCVWVEVGLEDGVTARLRLVVVGTGRPVPADAGDHIATVQDGPWCWHFYASRIGFSGHGAGA
jgi:hypothetical protein